MNIPVLMYHEVAKKTQFDQVSNQIQYSYILDLGVFKQQIQHLKKNEYQTLSLDQMSVLLKDAAKAEIDPSRKYIVLTFDDGLRGNFENIFPTLLENGFIGNFFLITGKIGDRSMMAWDQIKEMQKYGMVFGSHGVSHLMLGSLDPEKMFFELDYSKRTIEERLGVPVDYLSLPHGSYNRQYRSVALQAGYRGGCTSDPGLNHTKTDPFFIKRMNVPRNGSLDYFAGLCEGDNNIYFRAFIKKKLTNTLKKMIGETYYLSIYNKYYSVDHHQ